MYRIYDLQCNNMPFPQGIDDAKPTFSWKLDSDQQDTYQVSYRLRVYLEECMVWDTGFIKSDKTFDIPYQGEKLKSGQLYFWEAESINNYGEKASSTTAKWQTGNIESRWLMKWISTGEARKEIVDCVSAEAIFAGAVKSLDKPEEVLDSPVYFRKEIGIEKEVKHAVAFATAKGIYDLQIDGQSVSHLFAPEYTSYNKHLEYQTYDVTKLLTPGRHGIGVILADGWYTGKIGLMGVGNQYGERNSFYLQIEVTYTDGTKELLGTDESFKWSYGGYRYSDLFVGEYYVQAKELTGYSKTGFDDSSWKQVVASVGGFDILQGQSITPARVVKKIVPEILCTPKGEVVLDAGANIVGFTRYEGPCEEEVEISFEHSEVLDQNGNFQQNILGQHKNQKDRILPNKTGIITYKPKFTFHGFRYVLLEGIKDPKAEDFEIWVIDDGLERTGSFVTSNEDINQLQENIYRSQQGNMLFVPTDCPQRERAGWTGDMQVYAPTATFNMDVLAFLKRWLKDMRLEQKMDGQIPNVIPAIDSNKYIDGEGQDEVSSAGWGDACVIVPYRLYQAYQSKEVLKDNFQMMCRWMDYVESKVSQEGLWDTGFHFGDWLIPSIMKATGNPMETAMKTKEEVASAMYAYTTEIMIDICNVLGEKKRAEHYLALNQKTRTSFSIKYISSDGRMRNDLQGLYVLALGMRLVDEHKRQACVRHLVNLVHENDDCLDTGFLSVPFLLETLYEEGEKELAYTLLFQKKSPSWLYAVTKGATTIWENWEAIRPDGTRTNSSYNHFAFGCVGEFMYKHIGGLEAVEAGYRKIKIAPDINCGLDWAKTSYVSRYGEISIDWDKKSGNLEVKLPPNTSGEIWWNGKTMEIGNGRYLLK